MTRISGKSKESFDKLSKGPSMENQRKARFHSVMADHYAHGGTVSGDEISFGDNEEFLAGGADAPSGGEMDNEMGMSQSKESGEMASDDNMSKMRKRLKSLR